MRLAALITMAAIAVASAEAKSETGRDVTVYYNGPPAVPTVVRVLAQRQAAEMFASIGVSLHWRVGAPPKSETDAIVIDVVTDTPPASHPGAMAYAFPYEGVHIRILWDRIHPDAVTPDPSIHTVLAHVMVHEITHILQGVARHSGEGIMKAQWNARDLQAMGVKPMRFTDDDVERIYLGMDARSAASSALASRRIGMSESASIQRVSNSW